MALFIGRLGPEIRTRDLEDVFGRYGRLVRCDLKNGGYGFVDFEDRRDAEDALRGEDGRSLGQSRMVVQWANGPSRRADSGECFKCGRPGHIARECLNQPNSYRGGRSPSPYSRRRSPSPRGRYRSRSRSPRRRSPPRSPPKGRSHSRSPPPRENRDSGNATRSPARSPARNESNAPRSPATSPPRADSRDRSPARAAHSPSPAPRGSAKRSPTPP